MMLNNYKKKGEKRQLGDNQSLNEIFMIRIKIGTESNQIYVAAPDRIIDVLH